MTADIHSLHTAAREAVGADLSAEQGRNGPECHRSNYGPVIGLFRNREAS